MKCHSIYIFSRSKCEPKAISKQKLFHMTNGLIVLRVCRYIYTAHSCHFDHSKYIPSIACIYYGMEKSAMTYTEKLALRVKSMYMCDSPHARTHTQSFHIGMSIL